MEKHEIPPNKWTLGIPPNDGREYLTYRSPLGNTYYTPKTSEEKIMIEEVGY